MCVCARARVYVSIHVNREVSAIRTMKLLTGRHGVSQPHAFAFPF